MERPTAVPENLKAHLKDSYDAIAEKYTVWATSKADIRVGYLEALLRLLPPTHRNVLEIGCGAGVPTTDKLRTAPACVGITANDLSPAQIALGKARLDDVAAGEAGRVTWVKGDMMELEFAEGSFDIVLGFYTVQHLPLQEQVVMLGKVMKWLRPGGYMLINFPAEESENVVMTEWMGPHGWMYRSGWGMKKCRALVLMNGLDIVLDEVKEDHVKENFLGIIAKKPEA